MSSNKQRRTILLLGAIGLLLFSFAAEAHPVVRIVPREPMMKFGDLSRKGASLPFAKDPTVIRVKNRYLMYYSVCPYTPELLPAGKINKWGMAVAESKDLTHWTRVADLNVGQDGSAAPCVKKINGKIHLFYQTYQKPGVTPDAICHATSEDGITFTDNPENPIYSPKAKWSNRRAIDAEVFEVDDKLMLQYATRDPQGKIQQIGQAVAPLHSNYGKTCWTELSIDGPILKPELCWEGKCIEATTVLKRGETYYMFYAGGYNNAPQMIGLATSTDGLTWKRASDQPLLPNGAPGTWNSSESGHPGIFVDDDDAIYLFYQGNNDKGRTWFLSNVKIEFKK